MRAGRSKARRTSPGALFAGALAALPFLALLAFVIRYGITLPYWDQWEFVPYLDKLYAGELRFGDLYAQHNAHRIVFPRLVMLALARASAWNIALELAVNVALGLAIYAVWLRILRRSIPGEAPWARRALAVLASVLVFSMAQWRNWLWGWQMQIFMAVLAGLLALHLLAHPRLTRPRFIGAVLAGFVGTYSFASGMAVWPAGLVVLFARRRDLNHWKGWRLLWSLTGAAAFASYLAGFETPDDATPLALTPEGLLRFAAYILALIGGGLCNVSPPAAVVLGAGGLAAFAWRARRLAADPAELAPHYGVAAFVLASALITALGRSGEGIGQAVESRYMSVAAPFWISLATLATRDSMGERGADPPPRRGQAALVVLLILVAGLTSLHGAWKGSQQGAYRNAASAALVAGEDRATLERLYPEVDTLLERRATLERLELSVFARTAQ